MHSALPPALLLASVQASLLVPCMVLDPEERANLFMPLLQLILTVLCVRSFNLRQAFPVWGPWALLSVGLAAVCLASPEPMPALWRSLVFFVPAAAGQFFFLYPQFPRTPCAT